MRPLIAERFRRAIDQRIPPRRTDLNDDDEPDFLPPRFLKLLRFRFAIFTTFQIDRPGRRRGIEPPALDPQQAECKFSRWDQLRARNSNWSHEPDLSTGRRHRESRRHQKEAVTDGLGRPQKPPDDAEGIERSARGEEAVSDGLRRPQEPPDDAEGIERSARGKEAVSDGMKRAQEPQHTQELADRRASEAVGDSRTTKAKKERTPEPQSGYKVFRGDQIA